MTKSPKAFRLSDQAIGHLANLTEQTGANETAVIEMALARIRVDYRTTPQDAPEMRDVIIIAPDDNEIAQAVEAIWQKYPAAHAIRVLAYLDNDDLTMNAVRCEAYRWESEPPTLLYNSDEELDERRAFWRALNE